MKKYILPAITTVAVIGGIVGVALTTEKPLVSINGTGITKEMLDDQLSNIPQQLIQGQEEQIRKNVLERLIEQELVQQHAVDVKANQEADFKKKLQQLTRNFTYKYMLNKEVSDRITDDALMAHYEEQKQNLTMPRAKARHILVKEESEAKNIIKALDAGKNFASLASEKSIGPSSKNGGDLGWFGMTDMVPSFAQAAFALDVNKYSKTPVKTQFGWHVILLEDKDMSYTLPFEDVKDKLNQYMTEKVVTEYLDELRKNANIQYYVDEDKTDSSEDDSLEEKDQE